jgi:hypothetical protein
LILPVPGFRIVRLPPVSVDGEGACRTYFWDDDEYDEGDKDKEHRDGEGAFQYRAYESDI